MESNPTKEQTKLKILIYGDNINTLLINKLYDQKKCKNIKKNYIGKDYNYIKHNILGWELLCFENINNQEIINLMKDDHKKKIYNHVLLIFIDNSEKQIEIITQIDNSSNIYFPFIIFFSSNKKEKSEIIELVEKNNLGIDYRYLTFINRDCLAFELLNILWQKCCYYNQLGNSINLPCYNKLEVKISKYFHSFNFFIIGKTGVGKSTLINILCGDLVALERGGKNVTVGAKRYRCLYAPIYFYDTEGFSSGQEIENTKKVIFDTLNELNRAKQTIHGIFYLFNGQSKRTFDDNEEKLIQELFSKGIDIYFLINFMSQKKKKKNNKVKEIFIEENEFRFNNPEYNTLFEQNLFVINLKNDDFDCHGLDRVFDAIYEKLKNDKIDLDAVRGLKDEKKKIFPLLKHSSFFKNINSADDVVAYIKNFCEYEIYTSAVLSALAGGLDVIPFSDIPVIYGIETLMIISIAISFGVKLEYKKAKELLKSLSISGGTTVFVGICGYLIATALKLIPGIGSIIGGIINASVAAGGTITIGKLAVNYFSKIFSNTEVIIFLNSRAEACNKGIDFFNEFKIKLKESNDYSQILSD